VDESSLQAASLASSIRQSTAFRVLLLYLSNWYASFFIECKSVVNLLI